MHQTQYINLYGYQRIPRPRWPGPNRKVTLSQPARFYYHEPSQAVRSKPNHQWCLLISQEPVNQRGSGCREPSTGEAGAFIGHGYPV